MKHLTKNDILNRIMENGFVLVDDGGFKFVVLRANKKNIGMTEKLEAQLKAEGLYDNSYIATIMPAYMEKCDIGFLPIYGNSEKYVTKHFSSSKEKALESMLNDRTIAIVERANNYLASQA